MRRSGPIARRTPLRRTLLVRTASSAQASKPKAPGKRALVGRVTPEMAATVLTRDGGCVVPLLDPTADECRDAFGRMSSRRDADLTLDHVHEEGKAAMGKKPPGDPDHLVTLCRHHGVQSWELTHKRAMRHYLRAIAIEPDPASAAVMARNWEAFE
jgi:hypothetical protein